MAVLVVKNDAGSVARRIVMVSAFLSVFLVQFLCSSEKNENRVLSIVSR